MAFAQSILENEELQKDGFQEALAIVFQKIKSIQI